MNKQQRTVIQQALEALELTDNDAVYGLYRDEKRQVVEAIIALRQLLEQPEQADEPVAYRSRLESGSYAYCNTPQFFDNAEALYTRPQPAAAIPEGWKLVPINPTPEMLEAVDPPSGACRFRSEANDDGIYSRQCVEIYQAFLDAAPMAPQPEQACPHGADSACKECHEAEQPAADSVPMPKNVEQAKAMALLGMKWLETNAPGELKQSADEPVACENIECNGHWITKQKQLSPKPQEKNMTDMITLPRAEVQQALDALERAERDGGWSVETVKAITALRRALESPTLCPHGAVDTCCENYANCTLEPVAYCHPEAIQRLRDEPSDWMLIYGRPQHPHKFPLYTRPQPAAAIPEEWKRVREWAEKWAAITYEDSWKYAAREVLAMLAAAPQQKGGAA